MNGFDAFAFLATVEVVRVMLLLKPSTTSANRRQEGEPPRDAVEYMLHLLLVATDVLVTVRRQRTKRMDAMAKRIVIQLLTSIVLQLLLCLKRQEQVRVRSRQRRERR